MSGTLQTEIKLWLITRQLYALYNNRAKVKQELEALFGHVEDLHPAYYGLWLERYAEINQSRNLQIILLKSAGYTYRQIQRILSVSFTTIQRVLETNTLDYGEMEGTNLIESEINEIGERFKMAGNKLW